MCGIFGWSRLPLASESKQQARQRVQIAASLACDNTSRGQDSFGFYADGIRKRGLGMFSNVPRTMFVDMARANRVMAHTRAATHGMVTKGNCHPFSIGDVVGAHNGVVHNHDQLNIVHDRKFNVDSMHIFAHIDEDKDVSEIKAWGAIEFLQKKDPCTIWLGRFHGGSLAVRQTDLGIFWSSDDFHLMAAMRSSGVKSKRYTIKPGELYQACNGILYLGPPFPVSPNDVSTSVLWQDWDDRHPWTWRQDKSGSSSWLEKN